MSKFKEIWADSQSTEGGHMTKAEELADAICRIDTLTEYQRELIAKSAAELRRIAALEKEGNDDLTIAYLSGYSKGAADTNAKLEQAAEPVAVFKEDESFGQVELIPFLGPPLKEGDKLYTHPAPRKPMTDAQRRRVIDEAGFNTEGLTQDDFAQEIISGAERFHQIKE